MRLDKLTVKAQEAIQAAQSLADQGSHQAVEPEHLLQALLQQQEGVVGPLLAKLGARQRLLEGGEVQPALKSAVGLVDRSGIGLFRRKRRKISTHAIEDTDT